MADHLSLTQAAALLDRSERFVGNLRERGFVKTPAAGQYPLVALARGVISYYEDLIARQNDAACATAATDARTREIEQRIRRKSTNLIPRADVEAIFDEWLPAFAAAFEDVPERAFADPARRAEVRAEIDAALARLTKHTETAKHRLETGEFNP